jgi:hypothetical protein
MPMDPPGESESAESSHYSDSVARLWAFIDTLASGSRANRREDFLSSYSIGGTVVFVLVLSLVGVV